jgi:hypothetical protein
MSLLKIILIMILLPGGFPLGLYLLYKRKEQNDETRTDRNNRSV